MVVDIEKTVDAIETLLEELERIGAIKKCCVRPIELNQKTQKDFETIILKLKTNLGVLVTVDKGPHKVQQPTVIQSPQIQQPTQNTAEKSDLVQLQVDKDEITRRISAFTNRKRKEVDEWNVQEFCSRPYIDEKNPVWEQIDSCARVDAVFIPRLGSKSHVKVSKVENKWGPQTQQSKSEAEKQVKIEPGTEPVPNVALEAIEERINTMVSYLQMNLDSSQRSNIFTTLKKLEDRILFLEGISPDYFNLTGPTSVIPKRITNEKEKTYSSWSVDDISKRIQLLEQSLKSSERLKKESKI